MTDFHDIPPERYPGLLLIDPMCREGDAFVRGLEARGWCVWLVSDPETAAAVYAVHADEIDVALVGMRVPGLDGVLALVTVRELNPYLPCCATVPDPHSAAAVRRAFDIPTFTRPPDALALSFTLHEMIVPVGKPYAVVAR